MRISCTALLLLPTACLSFAPKPVARGSSRLYEGLDDLRNMLESSWNVESMGQVPNSPDIAAKEAASSIVEARNDGLGKSCFVDLLLPQYDVQQGSNLYDEVEAVEFCTMLAHYMKSQSVVYVRDQVSLNTVSRVIESRERERESALTEQQQQQEDKFEYDEVEVEIDEDDPNWDLYNDDGEEASSSESTPAAESKPDIFDDFSDFSDAPGDNFFSADSESDPTPSEADAFRDALSSGWDDAEDDAEPKKKRTKIVKKRVKRKIPQASTTPTVPPRRYRLASLFGNNMIARDSGMQADVVNAVKRHGMPKDDEETMILLSANSPEEMLAIRALVTKFKNVKNIVLVNCRLDPLPLELQDCSTVYHLTPLIATATVDERDLFNKKKSEEEEARPPIKVVSIRRYPGDWEVYVDADSNGFELAERAVSSRFEKKGPPFEWIGGAIKSFLLSRNL